MAEMPTSEEQEKRALVQRVANSAGFRSAPRLREFLLFVTDLALSGRASEISEQHIGHVVFHRPADYETATDNSVRVSARQLRVKLKEYAESEGGADAWSLDIPKGGYVPVFTRRETKADAHRKADSAAVSSVQLRTWKMVTLVCASLALAASAAYLHARFGMAPRDSGHSPLTGLIIQPGQRTIIVMADSSMVLLHELTGHLITADDYATRQSPPLPQDPSLQDLAVSMASQQLTSIADVGFALRLLRVRPDAADLITVIHARNAGPRRLKEGNAILLGGPRSNPWAKLFEDRLSYRFEYSGEHAPARIANLRPRPGEPAFYDTELHNGRVRKSFARIAFLPNTDNPGRVLLIAGASIEATEAATEFFLGRHSATTLTRSLGRSPSAGPGFEVLLEITALDGAPSSSRIVGSRPVQ